ncbi:MFS transporter [Streptomonospora sp. PA3]|uniref:MDR family MFS transporter n=1 Tax=Streptomonospora sp. PA3 TaxID=2607326 RepID=UPI0012DC54B7|nr:MDR family MFS transporter [Streptomonospora sp. PA3]MUL44005.1 MFS transporter [Streptomonospora sp. PA3]
MGKHAVHQRERRERGDGGGVVAVMAALLLAVLPAGLDQTAVAATLPAVVGDLGGLNHLSWVITSYLLAVAAGVAVWDRVGDRYGRKRVFLCCIAVFLAGSALCGAAQSMPQLIGFRALQGIGAGGVVTLALAVAGDAVPPRERGRYQSLIGAAFGAACVAGPVLGGLFADRLTWRWLFYINLPLGAIAFLAVLLALPAIHARTRRRIDYRGAVLPAAAAVCLTAAGAWGGRYGWTSPTVLALVGAAALLGALWWLSALRTAEPALPPRTPARPTVAAGAGVLACAGFAMMGATAYLPLFLQAVQGYSPTASGLHLLPMALAMPAAAVASGRLASRTGRCKPQAVAGTAAVAAALGLLSPLGPQTPIALISVSLLLLGGGLGAAMQAVLTAMRSAAGFPGLGAATAAGAFTRSAGACLGAAVLGAVLAARLAPDLRERAEDVDLPRGLSAARLEADPRALDALPANAQAELLQPYAAAIGTAFLCAVPVALAAVVLALLLKETPLRTAISAPEPDEVLAPAAIAREPLTRVENAAYGAVGGRGPRWMYERLAAAAGFGLSPAACWTITHIAATGSITGADLARMCHRPTTALVPLHEELHRADLLSADSEAAGGVWRLNAGGREAARRLFDAQEGAVRDALAGLSPREHPDLAEVERRVARNTLGDEEDAELAAEGPQLRYA